MHKKTNALRLLDAAGISYALTEYRYDAGNLSVEQIVADNGLEEARIFKTLVLKGDGGQVFVAVIPGDKQLDFKAMARLGGCRKVALVETAALQALTGYMRGGCSPLGMKKRYPVFLDHTARNYDRIWVNAGARGLLMVLAPDDLARACDAEWAELVCL